LELHTGFPVKLGMRREVDSDFFKNFQSLFLLKGVNALNIGASDWIPAFAGTTKEGRSGSL